MRSTLDPVPGNRLCGNLETMSHDTADNWLSAPSVGPLTSKGMVSLRVIGAKNRSLEGRFVSGSHQAPDELLDFPNSLQTGGAQCFAGRGPERRCAVHMRRLDGVTECPLQFQHARRSSPWLLEAFQVARRHEKHMWQMLWPRLKWTALLQPGRSMGKAVRMPGLSRLQSSRNGRRCSPKHQSGSSQPTGPIEHCSIWSFALSNCRD